MKKIILNIFLALVLVCGLTACTNNGGGNNNGNNEPQKDTSVTISFAETQVSMTVGETKQIKPSVKLGKDVVDFSIAYSLTSNIATVDQNANVTAVATGTVILIATGSEGTAATVTIVIAEAPTPQPEYYTVAFNSNGGSTVASQTVEEGKAATAPANPTKEGYVFKGWLLNGQAYDFSAPVNGNITLVASWEEEVVAPTTYVVTFNSDGGSTVASQTVEEGKAATAPANPTKQGFVFKGWLLNGQAYDFSAPVNGNITLVASWEEEVVAPTTYVVTFNSDGGSNVASQTVEEGKAATAPANPTKQGYVFKGWLLNGQAYDFSAPVNGNITLVASWEEEVVAPEEYSITYNVNGGSISGSYETSYTVEDAITLPRPTKAGYVFVGWYENASFTGSAVTAIPEGSTGNKVFYAKWVEESTGSTVNVSYNLDGGSILKYDSREAMIADLVVAFKAYYSDNTTLQGIEADGSNIFAKTWNANSTDYLYQFFANSTEWAWVLAQINDVRTDNGLPKIDGTLGYLESRGEVQAWINGTDQYVYNDVAYGSCYCTFEVYHGWKEYLTSYLVTTSAYTKVAANTAILSSLPNLEKYGYTFEGWFTSSDYAEASKVTATTTLSATTVLYAKWEAVEYTVTYVLNGGTNAATAPQTYTVVEGLTLPTPTNGEYTFNGWYLDEALTQEVTDTSNWAQNVTLYAKWQMQVAKVTYNFNGGVSEELYKANGTVLSTVAVNNYNNANGGSHFTADRYNNDVFVYSLPHSSTTAKGWTHVYLAEDTATGFYTVVGVSLPVGTSETKPEAPATAQYVITVFSGYTGTATANFKAGSIAVGSVVMIDGDITAAKTSNPVNLTFYDKTIENNNLEVVLTTSSTLLVPIKVGFGFQGWYDESGKKYSSLLDFTGDVTLTAKWVFDNKVIGSFDTQSWVVVGDQITLSAEYATGDVGNFTWTSETPNIATVEGGVVTGVGEGVAKIKVFEEGYENTAFTFYVTVFATAPSGILKVLAESNNTSIYTKDNVPIGAGTPAYYYDVVGSVSKVLFENYKEHNDYYMSNPSNKSTLTGAGKGGVDFITVHYAADMPYSAKYSLTGGKNLASYNQTVSGASWHYSVGNDGIWYCQNVAYGAWHAGSSKTMTWTNSGVTTSQVGTDIYTSDVTLGSDGYFYLKGIKTTIKNTTGYTRLNTMGLGVKLVGSNWYIGGHYYNSSYGYISSTGGNNNSIGMETSVREGSDLWLTWQYTAQLCAKLLLQFELPLNRLVGHHFFSGKDCPQPMLEFDMEIWFEFVELVRQQMDLYTSYRDATLSCTSASTYVNNKGRVTSLPAISQCVTYDVTYTHNGTTNTVTLSTILPGTEA